MSKKLILIDGHSILNRAFFALPDLTNSEGIHTNALYGFLNIMFKFIDEEKPDYITVAFDLSAPTFRHNTFKEYKGTRKPMAPELKEQVPLMKEILRSMNISIVEKEGFEADDILGTLAKSTAAKGIDVSVISGDRDLLQLSDEKIKIRIPKTKKGVTEVEDYLPENVKEAFGVTPLEFIDMKALMGDTSDNIPGAPGIGPKTAASIIMKYHNIENVFEHIDEVTPPKAKKSLTENREQVELSKYLATIVTDVPIEYDIENAKTEGFFNPESYELFKRFNFKSMLKRFDTETIQADIQSGFQAEEHFKSISEFSEIESLFASAKKNLIDLKRIGLGFVTENEDCIGISICLNEEQTYFIPAQGLTTSDYLLEKIIELSEACKTRQIITINLKDNLCLLTEKKENSCNIRVDQKAFADVSLAAYLINPSNEAYDYDLLARDFFGVTVNSKAEILGKTSLHDAMDQNQNGVMKMSCLISSVSLLAWDKIEQVLESEDMYSLFDTIEMPLLFVLYAMQAEGVRVNKEALKIYGDKLAVRIEELEGQIYEMAGEKFNINSPKQLGVILFEKLEMPNAKKTKSGYSTAADVLDKLAPEYPIVSMILEYRQLTKLKSTYADGLAVYIKEDGRIHGKFNQTITATGRISSTEPNLQNIPIRMELGREIRKVFIPEENYVFLDADYSQIELRILAHMSGDEKLIAAYNSAQDIHRITASQVFNVPFEDVTDLQRRNAKAVNFGIIYGISSFGLSQDLSISKKEASEYINKYFNTYPSIKSYIDGLVTTAKETGYSLTMFQRRRQIPELKSSNFMQRSFGERVAMNAPIQGTAADIIKLAMVKVYDMLKEKKLKSRLILQVHDELLVETHKDEITVVKEIITDAMKHAAKLLVPLEIDLKQGDNWLEAH